MMVTDSLGSSERRLQKKTKMAPPSSAVSALRWLRRVTRVQLAAGVFTGFLLSVILGISGEFFLFLLLSTPVVAFFGHVFNVQAQYDVKDREVAQLLVTFLGGIFPGVIVASLIESLIAPLLAVLCFYDQQDTLLPQLRSFLDENSKPSPSTPHSGRVANLLQTLDIHKTFGYYVFMFLAAFIVAGLVEEATKLWIVQGKCLFNCSSTRQWLCDPRRLLFHRTRHANHHIVIVWGVVAAALGFSFIENIGYTAAMPSYSYHLQSAVLRSALSTPLHCLCGALSGMRLARVLTTSSTTGDSKLMAFKTKMWVLSPAIFVHGSFDLQIFIASSLVSDADASIVNEWVIPMLLTFAVLAVGHRLCRKEWSLLTEVSSNHTGAYAHIGGGEDDAVVDDDSDDEGDDATTYKRSANGVLLV